jgi:hypothetical protein
MFHVEWEVSWYVKNIVARILLGLLPGAWIPFAAIGGKLSFPLTAQHALPPIFTQSWETFVQR